MRLHDHYPGCRYNGMPIHKAWLAHLRSVASAWLIVTGVLYLVLVVVSICVKAIR